MTTSVPSEELNVAPGSIVVVRDEEWLVTLAEQGSDRWLVKVRGLSELVSETTATFWRRSIRASIGSRCKTRVRPR